MSGIMSLPLTRSERRPLGWTGRRAGARAVSAVRLPGQPPAPDSERLADSVTRSLLRLAAQTLPGAGPGSRSENFDRSMIQVRL
jgi:hypothetical protein